MGADGPPPAGAPPAAASAPPPAAGYPAAEPAPTQQMQPVGEAGAPQVMLTYDPFNYAGGPPHPIAPITDPTPAEQREQAERVRQEKLAQKDEVTARAVEQQKSKGGFLNKLNAAATNIGNQIEKQASHTTAQVKKSALGVTDEFAQKRYINAFPNLSPEEKLIGDYSCKVINNGTTTMFPGYIQVTERHFCFVGDNKLNFFFPFTDIVSINTAVTLATEGQAPPFILPIPAPNVVPTAIQIYTKQNQLHQIGYFGNIKDMLNDLDHLWRRSTTVPVPGVAYV